MAGADFTSLEIVGIFLVAAAAVTLVARLLKMPTLVSYLLAGLLLGPLTGLVSPVELGEAVDAVAELGIVLLMFLVGVELSLERVRRVGKVAVAAGLGQVVFTAGCGFLLCLALRFEVMEAIFLATALTFSSTVVVVKLLDQKGELGSVYGRIAVGIFVVQDLVVVVALTLLAGLVGVDADGTRTATESLLWAFGGMVALLAACLLSPRYLLARPVAWVARSPRALLMLSLSWCLAFVLAADALELSPEIGAFLAGLSIAQLDAAQELRRRVHPLMMFFVAVFFVSLGSRMELSAATTYGVEALVLSLFVLVGNPFIFMLIIARFGYGERTCFLTSVTVAQISEFSFVFAAMGVSAELIGQPMLSLVAIVGIITFAASSYLILYNHQLYALMSRTPLLRLFRARPGDDEDQEPEPLRDHIVIVGMNALGRRLSTALHERGELVLAVDVDSRKLAGLPCPVQAADLQYASALEDVGIPRAKLVISALRIEATNKLLTFRSKEAGVPVAVYAFDSAARDELASLVPEILVESKAEAGRRMAKLLEELSARTP